MRLHLTSERWITACSSNQFRCSKYWIGTQDTIQWLRFQARLTLTVICTLRICVFITRAFITICSSCTLGIGPWQKSNFVCWWFVTKFSRSRYVEGGSLPVIYRTAEQSLAFRFYPFELSWWKSVQTIYFKIQGFGGPNIQVSQNVVKSASEAFRIEADSRKCGIQLNSSCRSSAESLSRSCLLRFTLSGCSSIMESEWPKLF